MNDLSVYELVERANKLLLNPNVEIYFKFTCHFCGSRQTFSEPNMLYEEGICEECQKTTIITCGGFSLIVKT